MRRALAVMAFLSTQGNIGALTSIVAVRTPTTLYLGADSLIMRWNGSEKSLRCKIQQSGEVFAGFALITGVAGTDFDFSRMADDALCRKEPLRERIQRFAHEAQSGLTISLEALHRFEAEFFDRRADHRTVSEAVFLGFEDEEPKMFLRWFVAGLEHGLVSISEHAGDCPGTCPSGLLTAKLGIHQGEVLEVSAPPAGWYRDIPGAIERLIERDIKEQPAHVAGPIAIVKIDGDGAHWIRQGLCHP